MTEATELLALRNLINALDTLPVDAKSDKLDKDATAASVQLLPGARWLQRYVSGGGIREVPFAILLRVPDSDTAGRIDAAAALINTANSLEALTVATLPTDFNSIVGVDTPYLSESDDNATHVWRATYVLESVQSA